MNPLPPIVDAHIDTLLAVAAGERSLLERSDKGHADLPRLQDGGVKVQFFAHFIQPQYKPHQALSRFLSLLDTFYHELDRTDEMTVIRSVQDLDGALAGGRLGALISLEGGEPIGQDLAHLRMFFRLGLRAVGLVWNERNAIADGVGEPSRAGLTRFGREVVKEMNRLGMLVDVSHLNEAGFWDVLDVSEDPVIASHSNARALCDHPRNLLDEQIQALAVRGGVMGMNFCPVFVDAKAEKATLERVVNHIDHIVQLVGPAHVGLGSDFDGIARGPQGLEDATRFPALAAELQQRGYSDEDIQAILGGNFLRVLRQVLPAQEGLAWK